jgi:hypothetical protein
LEVNAFRFKARILLSENYFIDVFYGFSKQRIDFALIQNGRRIYGIDNLGGWHCHPWETEKDHMRINPLSIEEIVANIKSEITRNQYPVSPPEK